MRTRKNFYNTFSHDELEEAAGELNVYLKAAPPADRMDLDRDAKAIARALDRKKTRYKQRLDLRTWAAVVQERQRQQKEKQKA